MYRKMTVLSFIVIFAALAGGCGKKDVVEEKKTNAAKVIFAVGDVKVGSDSSWDSASEQMPLTEGQEIKTGPQSQCNIVVGSESYITVKENSHLLLATLFKDVSGVEQTAVELRMGKTVVKPKKLLKGDSFDVKTPTAVAGVRGTQFVVETSPAAQTKVAVVQGKVQMRRRIPALEEVDRSVVEGSEVLSSLEKKTEAEAVVISENKSAVIDNSVAEKENEVIEKVIEEHVAKVEEEARKEELSAENGETATDEAEVEPEERIDANELDRNLEKQLASLTADKPAGAAAASSAIVVVEEIDEAIIKDAEEQNEAIEKAKKEELVEEAPVEVDPATLIVNSSVPNGRISVNGTYIGEGSVTLTPDAGAELNVSVQAAGFETFSTVVSVKEGETRTVEAKLATGARLTIQTPVANSTIYVNGRYIGKGTATVTPGAGSKVTVEVRAQGFKDFTEVVTLNRGEKRTLRAAMEKNQQLTRLRWSQRVSQASMSRPVYYGNLVISAAGDGTIVALNRAGQQVWRARLGDRVESTPVVKGSAMYVVGNSGMLYSLSAANGKVQWKKQLFGGLLFGAQPLAVDNKVIVATSYGRVYGFSADGKELWQEDLGTGIYSTPGYHNGRIYLGTEDYTVYSMDIRNGKIKWEFQVDSRIVGARPVILDGKAILGTYKGTLYAINTRRGKDIWTFKADGAFVSSVLVDNGAIYAATKKGKVYSIDPADGKKKWEMSTKGAVSTAPVFHNTILYVASGRTLYAANAASGKVLWTHAFSQNIRGGLTVVNGEIYAGLANGEVAAVRSSLRDIYQ